MIRALMWWISETNAWSEKLTHEVRNYSFIVVSFKYILHQIKGIPSTSLLIDTKRNTFVAKIDKYGASFMVNQHKQLNTKKQKSCMDVWEIYLAFTKCPIEPSRAHTSHLYNQHKIHTRIYKSTGYIHLKLVDTTMAIHYAFKNHYRW